MALIGAIVLSFFLPWPLNLVVLVGGVSLEVGEVSLEVEPLHPVREHDSRA